ncbi:MAG: hypothetical protein A2622_12350 [Bdellovibrionales bacterium RIFCSPHIGHO2_01_FULL_40_29]|nr:MAG: hypothetical protein A2622_12350 [Bdellovibrionales bacterium RIFCSPHIGHO2_01_FULL_40_29]OFZ32976.1 MAG: hypothetical protein A3D17_09660 [Bdellovibrionales bacterium RIFCSPHIGHO2_02_FULL_40_15]
MAKTKVNAKTKNAKKNIKKPVKKPEIKAKKPVIATKAKAPAKKAEQKVVKDSKKEMATKGKKTVETVVHNAKAQPAAAPKTVAKPAKADSKLKSKSKKVEKKEDDFEEDLVGDEFGESEIAEYEEDLKAVEEDDIDINDLDLEETDSEVKDEEIYLTDSEGRRLCKVRDCDQVSTVDGYCRYHYLLLWKKIQTRKIILLDGKLEKYVEDLMARYPDKFVEVIKKDLKTEKDFISVIQELEIDESALGESESDDEVQSFTDEIRGIGDAPSMEDDSDY